LFSYTEYWRHAYYRVQKFTKIVWDEPKRLTNLAKHGLDFADLDTNFFFEAALGPGDDGRFVAVGEWAGITITSGLSTFGRRGHLCNFHATRQPKGARPMMSKKF
jgi:uncharacterized protein